MILKDEGQKIWEEIVLENFVARTEIEASFLQRLMRVKISRSGAFRTVKKRQGLTSPDRAFTWAAKHFPSLIRAYEAKIQRIKDEEKKKIGTGQADHNQGS